jgi:hypothetical protein
MSVLQVPAEVQVEGDAAAAGAAAVTNGVADPAAAGGGTDLRQLLMAKEVERRGGRDVGWSDDDNFEEVPQDDG